MPLNGMRRAIASGRARGTGARDGRGEAGEAGGDAICGRLRARERRAFFAQALAVAGGRQALGLRAPGRAVICAAV